MTRSNLKVTAVANDLFKKYCAKVNKLNYNCKSLLKTLLSLNSIRYHSYDFGTNKFFGMLVEIDGEWVVTTNLNHSEQQKHFTIGHELGHYYFHKDQESYFMDNKIEMLDSSNKTMEQEANLFASELLIPQQVLDAMLAEHYDFYRICRITKTSRQCLYWRLVRHLKETYQFNDRSAQYFVDQYKEYSNPGLKQFLERTYLLRFTKNADFPELAAERWGAYNLDRF